MNEKIIKKDVSKENPGLHLFYVKCAVIHLAKIDKCMEILGGCNNLNMMDMLAAMDSERKKLVRNNQAYSDADEILQSIMTESALNRI